MHFGTQTSVRPVASRSQQEQANWLAVWSLRWQQSRGAALARWLQQLLVDVPGSIWVAAGLASCPWQKNRYPPSAHKQPMLGTLLQSARATIPQTTLPNRGDRERPITNTLRGPTVCGKLASAGGQFSRRGGRDSVGLCPDPDPPAASVQSDCSGHFGAGPDGNLARVPSATTGMLRFRTCGVFSG